MHRLSVDEFLGLVERSQLVERDRLAPIIASWKSQATPNQLDDAEACADHLVRSELLTRWQSQKLLEGRHRGFLLGNYKLLDHLGSGGMSNVYLAEHLLMQRRVAIKVLPQHRVADASFLDRFHFEGQAVAALDHPNIVRAYDLGSEGRIHYLVMEYIEGSNLEELVGRTGPPDFHTAARYIAQAAEGLEHAHGSGLVHRDIKPANLLVDSKATVKILDMGLAKFEAQVRPTPAFARDEEVLGTAEYLAPEQALNSLTVDQRADIYGLGCTLYFLLTGHPPFQGGSTSELMAAHREQSPPSLLADRPDTPRGLVAICQKMMEKDPASRYQLAREVADALSGWLESERAAGRIAAGDAGPRISGALQDTIANFRDTAKIDPSVADSSSASSDVFSPPSQRAAQPPLAPGSDVIFTGPPPPLVSPPRNAHHASIPTVVPTAPGGDESFRIGRAPRAAPRQSGPYSDPTRRAVMPGRASNLLWTILLSALVLGAILLALFAFVE